MNTAISSQKILLISDDSTINAMLLDNLRAEGYDVEVVTSAEDALMLPVDEYNLLISEIDLPGEIDGYELLERIKEDPLTAGVPLMFCTVRDSENDIIKGSILAPTTS